MNNMNNQEEGNENHYNFNIITIKILIYRRRLRPKSPRNI